MGDVHVRYVMHALVEMMLVNRVLSRSCMLRDERWRSEEIKPSAYSLASTGREVSGAPLHPIA